MAKRGRPTHPDQLTPAEWRVIEGVRHGLTNPSIAERCSISVDAVKFHVSNSLSKLGFESRKELQHWPGVRGDSKMGSNVEPARTLPWMIGQISRLTRNLDETADWFRDTLRLNEVIRADQMAFFECGELRIYLSEGDPEKNSILYFKVNDIYAEIESLRDAFVEIKSAPHRIHVHPDGREEWMAFFLDPDGCPLALMAIVDGNPEEAS